ncbi:site-specific integrase [Fructilactobacillus fructivorans]|uniref:Recombinase XerD n=1 Tax=Fructilactobacillus fructivorans TaxID=1614 RepID=A0A0C1PP80_9LACO|nr:site-specific integrase [Fructilactobacillus fructivorans]KID42592.1 Site-specific recombinase XerD [Fructilactobacillus fructivorans]KRK58668.1 site-specific recombinase XerD [Fructilactobacillus fructivorans]MCT0151818.1 recombinase XerD [Fructilactobacillus fructivorans]MCT2868053.1 recombinase XerD [Fructilactobacillus fructivorans]MCT2868705.1 recombinase XerD [Fructilactobacillus fructivorans]
MTNNYPYQDHFERYLRKKELSGITIREYSKTLSDLFNYLSNFNVGYQQDHRVSQIFDRDIEQYLDMIVSKRNNGNNTYNKILSQINVYFKFLFNDNLNTHLPTINIKSKDKNEHTSYITKWLYSLPVILEDNELHYYTRMTLLLISKGYQSSEFLLPGFYQELDHIKFSSEERTFLSQFMTFITPLQIRHHTKDLFLKQRIAKDCHITSAGLHKYLKPDSEYLQMNLSPKYLYQSFVINYLSQHQKDNDKTLSRNLRMDPASLLYYQKLAQK